MIEIGTVQSVHRYPVKSMRGEDMTSAQLRWTGLDGDRQYGFYRAADRSRFPWHTGREVPDLVRHVARYDDPTDPRKSPLRVTTPDGASFDITSEQLRARLSEAAGEDLRMIQVGRGTFDSGSVSVISTATEAKLDRAFGAPLGLRRFRPNIIIRGDVTAWRKLFKAMRDDASGRTERRVREVSAAIAAQDVKAKAFAALLPRVIGTNAGRHR